jgi:integrase
VPHRPRKILDKETVDEMIFNARSIRDRLILELQARCGLRIGEVLKLRASDLSGRKILIEDPKAGRDVDRAFYRLASCAVRIRQTVSKTSAKKHLKKARKSGFLAKGRRLSPKDMICGQDYRRSSQSQQNHASSGVMLQMEIDFSF